MMYVCLHFSVYFLHPTLGREKLVSSHPLHKRKTSATSFEKKKNSLSCQWNHGQLGAQDLSHDTRLPSRATAQRGMEKDRNQKLERDRALPVFSVTLFQYKKVPSVHICRDKDCFESLRFVLFLRCFTGVNPFYQQSK